MQPLSAAQHHVQSARAVVLVCPLPAGILLESTTTGTALSLFVPPIDVRGRPANPFAVVFALSLCMRLTALTSLCARAAHVACLQLTQHAPMRSWQVNGGQEQRLRRLRRAPRHERDGRTMQPWRVVQGRLAAAASVYRPLLPSSMQHVRRVCRGRAGPRTPHTLGRCRSCWAAFARLGKHVTQEGSDLRDVPNVKKWYNRRVPMLD